MSLLPGKATVDVTLRAYLSNQVKVLAGGQGTWLTTSLVENLLYYILIYAKNGETGFRRHLSYSQHNPKKI